MNCVQKTKIMLYYSQELLNLCLKGDDKMANNDGKGSVIGTMMILAGIFLAPVGIGIILIFIGIGMFKNGYK